MGENQIVDTDTKNKGGKFKSFLGWLSIILMGALSCFWAFWGVLENFHEGWHYPSLAQNLLLMFVQYTVFLFALIFLSIILIFKRRFGAIILICASIWFAYWVLSSRPFTLTNLKGWLPILLPPFLISIGYIFGKLPSRQTQLIITIILPLTLAIGLSIEPLTRISRRFYDGNYDSRIIVGNEIELTWAAKGFGWPNYMLNLDGYKSPNWYEAQDMCARLSEDTKKLEKTPQNIWRLPTVDEAVRSMARRNRNCNGVWDPKERKVTYNSYFNPDKEQPLWDQYSPTIYWWTSTEVDAEHAYIIVYDGKVYPRKKTLHIGSLAFRAVRTPTQKDRENLEQQLKSMIKENDISEKKESTNTTLKNTEK